MLADKKEDAQVIRKIELGEPVKVAGPHELSQRPAYVDRISGSIGYGQTYGEFSYNGQPLYPGNLRDFLQHQPHLPCEPTQPLSLPEQKRTKRAAGG